uniref:ASPSCR1 tether for SLC2A4, UBX domain containing n=1 Tax=Cyprinus carpio carpio TaxID=630221 RepID=A0A9J7ZGN3_CYPCA
MAASGSTVSVLTPNGRRQTVKVSANTPLLQVLEDVCKKHGFNPEEHGLKFQRNVLDLSLQWRFSSLPNNAKLEMVVCSRPQTGAESAVRIALQMEDGSRLQGSFSSGQTLWDLLTHFPQTRCVSLLPLLQHVSGEEALKKTTLKSLGLTGGSAIIRYVLKGSDSSCPGVSVDAVAMPTDAVAKTTISQLPPEPPEEPTPVPMETPAPPTEVAAPLNHHPVKQEEEEPKASQEQAVRPKSDQLPSKLMPQEDDERPGTSQQCHASAPSATPTDFVPFSGSGQRLGGAAGLKMSTSWSACVSGSPPKAKKPKPSQEIKRSVSAKEATRDEEETDKYLEPVDREPLVFHLDSGARRHDDTEIPDEFFEVTVDDIRKRFAQLKSVRKALEEAPLVTKSLRESQMKEKLDRYPKVVLRVQFPDRRVLQGFFRPLETVAALRSFIRSHLQDPQMQFYLFVAPPKTILDDPNVTLFQASLFPAALVYFGSDVRTGLLTSLSFCVPRSPPAVSSHAPSEDDLPPTPESCDSSGQRGSTEDDGDAQAAAGRPVKTDPGKVPKWLKLPGVFRSLLHISSYV